MGKFIKDFCSGDSGRQVFYCTKKSTGVTRTGKEYYSLVISDKTGSLDAKVWDASQVSFSIEGNNKFFVANYSVEVYNGGLQVVLSSLGIVDFDSVCVADFYPTTKYSIPEMYGSLLKYLELVKDPDYRSVIDYVLGNEKLSGLIKSHSAACSVHHAFIGGWLQHTLGVVKLCYAYTKQYSELNADLLLTAAFLHDVGKFYELSAFPDNSFTEVGVLYGHVTYSAFFVHDLCSVLSNFPQKKADYLIHCLLAHHGELEWGSPVKPALLEARALSLADYTDSQLEIYSEGLSVLKDGDVMTGKNFYAKTNLMKTVL